MKGRAGFNGGAPPADLLLCFPSRAHLTLMPKPICSPNHHSPRGPARFRPTNNNNNHRNNTSKARLGSDIGSEPTSPKVTCAGQIKVRDKKNSDSPRPDPKNWLDALGLKKDVMNFLGALRGLRFNMHCFGNFHGAVDCCSNDDDEEDDEDEERVQQVSRGGSNVFSKWFMVLEENQENDDQEKEVDKEEVKQKGEEEVELAPPKNALLLMRCKSAPGEGRREEEVVVVKGEEEEKEEKRMMLMSDAPDFLKLSTEIAKETWVVGSVDSLMARSRSRSWRR